MTSVRVPKTVTVALYKTNLRFIYFIWLKSYSNLWSCNICASECVNNDKYCILKPVFGWCMSFFKSACHVQNTGHLILVFKSLQISLVLQSSNFTLLLKHSIKLQRMHQVFFEKHFFRVLRRLQIFFISFFLFLSRNRDFLTFITSSSLALLFLTFDWETQFGMKFKALQATNCEQCPIFAITAGPSWKHSYRIPNQSF